MSGVIFLSGIILAQRHNPNRDEDKDRQRRRHRDEGRDLKEKGMVRLTLRMIERSCFWARIWAISCRDRKKRRKKPRLRDRQNLEKSRRRE